ncbi:MAG TPA: triose-phosphate isomerase [Bdellovibrionales bacterium]|nr:triose-phosphate isomerase [Bdellovibrionales bacterium]
MAGFYCAGNWKMNKSPAEAREFVASLKSQLDNGEAERLVVIPPALCAAEVARGVAGSGVRWGGQNSYSEVSGAFTGENSPAVLKAMGASFCLVGHSERRQIFGETDKMMAAKVSALQGQGMTPILCVGETLAERESDKTSEVILRQLREGLSTADKAKDLWIAYEPVWAIGTGKVATPEQVTEAHTILRGVLKEWGAGHAPILYGGSVKPDNAGALAKLPNVDGFLIGGASLKVDDFLKILRG